MHGILELESTIAAGQNPHIAGAREQRVDGPEPGRAYVSALVYLVREDDNPVEDVGMHLGGDAEAVGYLRIAGHHDEDALVACFLYRDVCSDQKVKRRRYEEKVCHVTSPVSCRLPTDTSNGTSVFQMN